MAAFSYLTFRRQLFKQAISALSARLLASSLLICGIFGPLVMGLLAFVSAPLLYAATRPTGEMLAILITQAGMVALPVWCLRTRVLPDAVIAWQKAMPLSICRRLLSEVLVSFQLTLPWYPLHLISLVIWVWQPADWLHPVIAKAIFLVASGPILGTCLGALILQVRASLYLTPQQKARRLSGQRPWVIWQTLLWRPLLAHYRFNLLWHIVITVAVSTIWLRGLNFAFLPQELIAFICSTLLINLCIKIDSYISHNIKNINPIVAAWPVNIKSLKAQGKLLAVSPTLLFALGESGIALSGRISGLNSSLVCLHAAASVVCGAFISTATRSTTKERMSVSCVGVVVLGMIGSLIWSR